MCLEMKKIVIWDRKKKTFHCYTRQDKQWGPVLSFDPSAKRI